MPEGAKEKDGMRHAHTAVWRELDPRDAADTQIVAITAGDMYPYDVTDRESRKHPRLEQSSAIRTPDSHLAVIERAGPGKPVTPKIEFREGSNSQLDDLPTHLASA